MKALLFIPFFVVNFSYALEFTAGEYELVSGDEKICEDGTLSIHKADLIIGSRYQFPNFKQVEYSYSSDDKSCEYKIHNTHSPTSYQQELKQICKKENESMKRVIDFTYISKTELQMKILKNQKEEICKLKLIK